MGDLISIEQLRVGDKVRIVSLDASNKRHLRKLTSFGVLPGTEAILLQTSPAYVLALGYTQIALDAEIAKTIVFIKEK